MKKTLNSIIHTEIKHFDENNLLKKLWVLYIIM